MKPVKSFLEKYGIHTFLLPLFAVLHSYRQYYGLVDIGETVKILGELVLSFLVFFLVILAITKNINKSLQLTTLFGCVFLFYGVVKDFFQITLHLSFISKYSVLLPALAVVAVILTRVIVKKKDFTRINLFQNLLLLIFILIDVMGIMASNNSLLLQRNLLTKNSHRKVDRISTAGSKPNVYYIVLDCYPGTHFLKQYMQYDNSLFNDALEEKGFRVLSNPRSNYNWTAFSISATLNFEYLRTLKTFSPVGSMNYSQALLTTKESIVPKIFKENGYTMYNLSIFDIGGNPSVLKENFLTLPEREVLLYNTLLERLKRDLLWHFMKGKYEISFLEKLEERKKDKYSTELAKKRDFNNFVIDSLMKIPLQETNSPQFVYAHVYLPHPPFFYNENGSENELNAVLSEKSQKNKSLFLSYLKYTNNVALKIIDRIMQVSGGHSMIILQSDHGFRDFEGGPTHPQTFFQNYSAFYFPDKNYSALYDTMSNINTFPVIFNKCLGTNIPLQADSSVFLIN
ncbi:MAG TPA: hypothetical protein VGQ53_18915 [Chitinophagaceae bacterium]|nr:hypothetical protein [Chitinophagaceae bacterium]